MRVKVQIIAEDHRNGMKSTREAVIDIPGHMLHEGVDPTSQVRGTAEWALQHAAHAVQNALQPQQAAYPGAPMGAVPAPGMGPPQVQMGGPHQPGYGAGTPFQGAGAPQRGTAAPLDPRRTPTTVEEIVAQSLPGVGKAVSEDKRKGAPFLDPNNNPSGGAGHIGWGPHRSK
jgi:hypothetical protein